MTIIARSSKTLSNAVIAMFRPELGYCVEVVKFKATADGSLKIGDATRTAAGAVAIAAVNVAGIIVEDVTYKNGDNVSVLMLVQGPATVCRAGLNFGALVAANVEATLVEAGIQFID